MGEKIKISRKLAEAIEFNLTQTTKEEFLKIHARTSEYYDSINFPLDDVPLIELAEILIKGYEIEESPEERLVDYYNTICRSITCEDRFLQGCQHGIHKVLVTLGIKIKGIND